MTRQETVSSNNRLRESVRADRERDNAEGQLILGWHTVPPALGVRTVVCEAKDP